MRIKQGKNFSTALAVALFSMLAPMIIATRLLHSTSYLVPFYAIGFIIQFVALTLVMLPFVLNKKFLPLFVLYFFILLLPIINDLISGIYINYFDPINSAIKLINFFMFFAIMQSVKINELEFARFMKIIVIFSIIACIYSLIFEYRDILSIRSVINTNTLNVRSFFSNRNQYSAFLIVAFTANNYLNQIEKHRFRMIIFALQIFCILTTFSRSAFFCMVIISLFMLLQNKNAKTKTILLILIFVIGLGVAFTTGVFDYMLSNYVRWNESADSGRFTLWKYAWDIAKDNLITGVGFYTGVDIAMSNGMELTQFHNMFFDLLVDGGILEVVFIVSILHYVYKRCRLNCQNKRLSMVYVASLIAFLFHACFESLSIFALSYSDTLYTIFYISVPILLSNMDKSSVDLKS